MKKRNIGYVISIVFIVLFLALSILLRFKSNNSVWAFCWMYAILIPAIISSYINIKNNKKVIHRIIFAIVVYAFAIALFITTVVIINPNVSIPLC